MSIPITAFGAANFGKWGDIKTIADPVVVKSFLEGIKSHGVTQIDTARVYGNGSCEVMLGDVNAEGLGFTIDTKVKSFYPGAHKPETIHESVKESLTSLKIKKINILYLHSPDRDTPFEDTARAINDEYKAGSFNHFGLSNFSADEVAQMVKICKDNGWILPTVYQGNYNALTRKGEEVLFPLLRKEKIAFYAYSPLAGGFLNGKANSSGATDGNRFDPKHFLGQVYQQKYFKDSMFKAIEKLNEIGSKHGITSVELATRWIYYHSQLKKEYGDAVIFGSSSKEQFANTMSYRDHGALPDEVVTLFEQIWADVKEDSPAYHN